MKFRHYAVNRENMTENHTETATIQEPTQNVNEISDTNEEEEEEEEAAKSCFRLGCFFKMFKRGKSAEYYMTLLNVKTAKIIAVLFVLFFGGIYHGALHVLYGVTPCKGLLKDGIYKSGSTAFDFRGDFNQGTGLWQPWGCMMHKYTNV